jgi:hypothetical protein
MIIHQYRKNSIFYSHNDQRSVRSAEIQLCVSKIISVWDLQKKCGRGQWDINPFFASKLCLGLLYFGGVKISHVHLIQHGFQQ